jgi:hypothetical protein
MKITTIVRRTLATAVIIFLAACGSIGLAWVLTSTPYGLTQVTIHGEPARIFNGIVCQVVIYLTWKLIAGIESAWKLTGGRYARRL